MTRAVRLVLCALLVVEGLTALLGGVQLVIDPSGRRVGLALEWLQGSPFTDYLWPGLVLGSLLGVLPLVAVYGVFLNQRWGWSLGFLVGVALMIWLTVQIRMIGYFSEPPLQLIYAFLAAAIAVLALVGGRRAV